MAIDPKAVKDPEEVAPKPGAESAPAEAGGDAGSQVETPDSGLQAPEQAERGTSPIATITDLRRDRRQLRSENETLKKQIQELMSRSATQPTREPGAEGGGTTKEATSLFEDPDRYLSERERAQRTQILKDIGMIAEKQEALKLIRSQTGFGENDEDAFADLMQENGLDVLAQTRPLKAAQLATKLWQDEKGIKPVAREAKARAGSVRGSAPAGGAQKITLSHIRGLQDRLAKGENVDKDLAEAWAAAKEGRIIED